MRKIRYQVACSVDGYIAGPHGELDWIPMDPEIDFGALVAEFDTLLMGRRTYEGMKETFPGMAVFVFSTTLRPKDHPDVTIVSGDVKGRIDALCRLPGKDIWLFGGGELFRRLWDLDLVDTVEPAVVPVVLGNGRPLLPPPASRKQLVLTGHRVYPESGIVSLTYQVLRESENPVGSG